MWKPLTRFARVALLPAIAACADGDGPVAGGGGPAALRLEVATTGEDPDPDGYSLSIGGRSADLPLAGTVLLEDLPPGEHPLEITGVAANCSVSPGALVIDLAAGETASAGVAVACRAAIIDRIVFTRAEIRAARPFGVYIVALDGSPASRMSVGDGFTFPAARVSPDGTRLAYEGADGIYVVPVGGGAPQRVTGTYFGPPVWSPDGKSLAFAHRRAPHNRDLYLVNLDDGRLRGLTAGLGDDRDPAWSPDGSTIAFSRDLGDRQSLHLIGVDRTGLRELPGTEGGEDPSWSPDGRRIAFSARSDSAGFQIWVVDLETGRAEMLTNGPQYESPLPGDLGSSQQPAWSPDGRLIAFMSRRIEVEPDFLQTFDIMVMNPDGTGVRRLTSSDDHDSGPAWGLMR